MLDDDRDRRDDVPQRWPESRRLRRVECVQTSMRSRQVQDRREFQ